MHIGTGKFIFLDIDGVLNDHAWREQRGDVDLNDVFGLTTMLDPTRVELINEIVEQTGAVIYLTSTLRHLAKLQVALHRAGLDRPIKGITPSICWAAQGSTRATRADEVIEIVKLLRPESFVVIDDEDHDWSRISKHPSSNRKKVEDFLIRTDDRDGGLKHEHVVQAVKLLGYRAS
jgi:hypothetical protein